MANDSQQPIQHIGSAASKHRGVTPLDQESRSVLPTSEAAYHLNRAQQTLRLWAMYENGPIRPLRVNGRLAWPVSELRRVLGAK
jgi:hypothetical protein